MEKNLFLYRRRHIQKTTSNTAAPGTPSQCPGTHTLRLRNQEETKPRCSLTSPSPPNRVARTRRCTKTQHRCPQGPKGKKELSWEGAPATNCPWRGQKSTFGSPPAVPPQKTLPFHFPSISPAQSLQRNRFFFQNKGMFFTSPTGKGCAGGRGIWGTAGALHASPPGAERRGAACSV